MNTHTLRASLFGCPVWTWRHVVPSTRQQSAGTTQLLHSSSLQAGCRQRRPKCRTQHLCSARIEQGERRTALQGQSKAVQLPTAAAEALSTEASGRRHEEEITSSNEQWQPASVALGGHHPGVTALLGVAAAVAPGIVGMDFAGPESVAAALAVLAGIVAVHEAGHFLAARLQNVHVSKFSIGFGPTLLKYQGSEVEYSLRAIPLGGFVGFPDDDPANAFPADDPDLLKNRPIKDRAIVISAGVIANILFAFSILLAQVNTVGVAKQVYRAGVRVPEVTVGSASERAGIRAEDLIIRVAGVPIKAAPSAVATLVNDIKAHPNQELMLTVERDGKVLDVPVLPTVAADGGGRIGVMLASNARLERTRPANPLQAVSLALGEFNRLTSTVWNGLYQIVFNFGATKDQVSGPVAIVAVGAEVARADISGLFQFAAIVNINLAVVNLLPLPALDGGYLALLVVEALRGKKLPQGLEQGIMASGLLLLTAVGFFMIGRDILNLTTPRL